MRQIKLTQLLGTFLQAQLKFAKQSKSPDLTRFCNALYQDKILNEYKTVKDLLKVDVTAKKPNHRTTWFDSYRNVGPKGYMIFCATFVDTSIVMEDWPFFKKYLVHKAIIATLKPAGVAPEITINPEIVKTDPETTVFQIVVSCGKAGTWKEVANTSREANMFLSGLNVMACFAGLAPLKLPVVPKQK